ncbi:MAG: hypothetical protein V1840_00895 [Candidatus Omnitrophota bacterium]
MSKFLLMPPVAFTIVFIAVWSVTRLLSGLALRVSKKSDGSQKPYACGEDTYNNFAQPDYSAFFAFAFFFTLAHVATLVMATIPKETFASFAMALVYVLGAVLGLSILLRK